MKNRVTMTPEEMVGIRKGVGLSQEELADEFDVARRTVQYRETGGESRLPRLWAYAMLGLRAAAKKKLKKGVD